MNGIAFNNICILVSHFVAIVVVRYPRIWTQYHRLGLCLRRGASTAECTMLSVKDSVVLPVGAGSYGLPGQGVAQEGGMQGSGGAVGGGASPHSNTSATSRPKSIRNILFPAQHQSSNLASPGGDDAAAASTAVGISFPLSLSLPYNVLLLVVVCVVLLFPEGRGARHVLPAVF